MQSYSISYNELEYNPTVSVTRDSGTILQYITYKELRYNPTVSVIMNSGTIYHTGSLLVTYDSHRMENRDFLAYIQELR